MEPLRDCAQTLEMGGRIPTEDVDEGLPKPLELEGLGGVDGASAVLVERVAEKVAVARMAAICFAIGKKARRSCVYKSRRGR